MLATTQKLSNKEIDEFHERGVLRFDFGFDAGLLDRIVEKVHPHYSEEFRQRRAASVRLQDAWLLVDEVRRLAVDDRVARALGQLMGRTALPFQTLNFPVGTSQAPHSDTVHFNTIPAGLMAGVWVALEDVDEGNGPLVYYPGSHKLPYYSMQDFGLAPGCGQYSDYESRIRDIVRENGLEPEYGLVGKGEALIWHANLLHGGAPRREPGRSRHSQVTHYFGAGCRYYTPMLSDPDRLAYRDPEWIPRSPPGRLGLLLRRLRRRLRGRLRRLGAIR